MLILVLKLNCLKIKLYLYINFIIIKMIKIENGIGIIYLFYINFINFNKV